jgi:CO/xanthine dehydrogenase FAD-binding subunit
MPGDSLLASPTTTTSPAGYAAPGTLEEALTLLAADSANTVIAGGTDLIPVVRAGAVQPGMLVDLRRLPLAHITAEGDRIRLGALVTFSDLLHSPPMASEYPALVAAAAEVGGPPIRNRATLGGNLVNASPAADSAPPLLAYDASVVLVGSNGQRVVPLTAFFEGPGRTVCRAGEIVTEVWMPRPVDTTVSSFAKLGPRLAMAVSIVSVAVRVTGTDVGSIRECRIALGSVAPTPIRAEDAERLVVSRGITADSVTQASVAAAAASSPIDDLRGTATYRRRMVEVLVNRLLTGLAEELSGRTGHG